MTKYIKEVIDKLNIQKDAFLDISKEIFDLDKSVNDYNLFIFSVIKRAVDIIDTFNYSTMRYNINTQVPLLRLQVDNCLILQLALLLKDRKTIYFELLDEKFEIKKYKHPTTKLKLSEGILADEIDNKFPKFKDLYKFCCKFVHFTRKAINSTVKAKEPLTFEVSICVGNRELKEDVLTNANSLIMVNKVLAYLIEKVVEENKKKE